MARVDWADLLPPDVSSTVRVDYSYLSVPDDPDQLYGDVARIHLAHDFIADVAWDDEEEEYIVTLSLHFYDKKISQVRLKDATDVVETVKTWAEDYARQCVPYSDTEITEEKNVHFDNCSAG